MLYLFIKRELNSLKRFKLTARAIRDVSCKAMNAKGNKNELVEDPRRCTPDSYDNIHRNLDKSLVKLTNWLKEVFDCEVMSLQKGVCDAICSATGGV